MTKTKNLMFSLVVLTLVYICVELISYALYRYAFGDYKNSPIQLEKINTIENAKGVLQYKKHDPRRFQKRDIVHPYLGYVPEHYTLKENCEEEMVHKCYDRTLGTADTPIPEPSDKNATVAILGGSVAVGVGHVLKQRQPLLDLFKRIKGFENKQITVVNLAAGGYKQPQHLNSLNYHYSLGSRYDLVIVLDGFNEMVLPFYAHRYDGVHPIFPQSWAGHMRNVISPQMIETLASKQALTDRFIGRTRFALLPIVRWSPTCNLIWKIMQKNYQRIDADLILRLSEIESSEEFNYRTVGPRHETETMEDMMAFSARIWAKGALLTRVSATSQGAKYFHFVQPNQHIEGSKPLSDAEIQSAYSPEQGYGAFYSKSYPYLKTEINSLNAEGIPIHDLTYLFKGNRDTLYIDNCCHFNSKGYGMLFEGIIDQIERELGTAN